MAGLARLECSEDGRASVVKVGCERCRVRARLLPPASSYRAWVVLPEAQDGDG
jgi:hypothetical protein